MTIRVNNRVSSLAVTMLAGWVAFAVPAWAGGNAESEQVSQLLADAKMQAQQLNADADRMESFTRSNADWESHTDAIGRIREDVNKMGKILEKLDQNRAGAAAWQQAAIDRVTPVARELATNTTAAIEHLSKQPKRLNSPEYQNYLEAIADNAANLANTVGNFVDYGKTRQRLERLGTKLEIPAGTL